MKGVESGLNLEGGESFQSRGRGKSGGAMRVTPMSKQSTSL